MSVYPSDAPSALYVEKIKRQVRQEIIDYVEGAKIGTHTTRDDMLNVAANFCASRFPGMKVIDAEWTDERTITVNLVLLEWPKTINFNVRTTE